MLAAGAYYYQKSKWAIKELLADTGPDMLNFELHLSAKVLVKIFKKNF